MRSLPTDAEATALADAVAALGDRLAYETLLRRLDEQALCFDPDPNHRAEVKRRLLGEDRERRAA